MTVALFSTAYFPPIAYVAALSRQAEVCIEAKETYPKQTFRNRMEIMTAGGVRALTVPVVRHNHSRTDEVGIDYRWRWNIVHLRTLAAAYGASPYWIYYQEDIESLLLQRYERLADLNRMTTEWLLRKLKISCRLTTTVDYQPDAGDANDYRNRFSPKTPLPPDGFPPYCQVFADRQPFAHNLSILDLLMNLGPEAVDYLSKVRYG